MSEQRRILARDVKVNDTVLRYGMWFTVEEIEKLPAERGGYLHNLSLKPTGRGGACYLALFPDELVTVQYPEG